jgi:hypothetical protein
MQIGSTKCKGDGITELGVTVMAVITDKFEFFPVDT